MIYWCDRCNIPLVDSTICSRCKNKTREIANDIRPVFIEEKKIISFILGKNVINSSVWNKNSVNYIIDGKDVRVDYVGLYQNDEMVDKLRNKYIQHTPNFHEILTINQYNYIISDKYLLNFVIANEQYIKKIEYNSQKYILDLEKQFGNKDVKPTVSFSGGKDSTVVSNLVREAYGTQKIIHIFGDTTLEFDTTYNYIKRFKKNNMFIPIISAKSEKDFFELCKEFGPPSRLERWCCTIFKTSPISESMSVLADSELSLSFLGIRATESVQRSNYKKTRYKSKISRQIVSMPILEWLNVDIWLYILYKKLDFNSAYTFGFTRVGCWCCPNNSTRSEFLLKLLFEKNYRYWHELLISYAKKAGIKDYDVYVDSGKWKSRRGLKGLNKLDVNLKKQDCKLDEKSKIYLLNKLINKEIIEFFKPFGKTTKIYESDDLVVYKIIYELDGNNSVFNIHLNINSRLLKIEPVEINNMRLFYQRVECQIRKYEFCINCMACESVCPHDAIRTANGYKIIENNCKYCLKCVAKFNGGCLRVEKHKSKI